MKKVFCLAVLLIAAADAAAQSAKIDEWLDQHRLIMQSIIPDYLPPKKKMTEEKYFKNLYGPLKIKYIEMFDQIHPAGWENEYQARADFARENFANLYCQPAWDILALGIPKISIPAGNPGSCILKWEIDGQQITIVYDHHVGVLEEALLNATANSMRDKYHQLQPGDNSVSQSWRRASGDKDKIAELIKISVSKWAPTKEGWKLWAETAAKF